MSLDTREDISYFKEMGKTFFRLIKESETLLTPAAQEAYVGNGMKKIYSAYELEEFYENLTFIRQQSDKLH